MGGKISNLSESEEHLPRDSDSTAAPQRLVVFGTWVFKDLLPFRAFLSYLLSSCYPALMTMRVCK